MSDVSCPGLSTEQDVALPSSSSASETTKLFGAMSWKNVNTHGYVLSMLGCADVHAMGLAHEGKVRDARASNPCRPRLIHFLEIKCCESISHITASDAHKKSGLSTMECKTL
jgi:hypothetical protein